MSVISSNCSDLLIQTSQMCLGCVAIFLSVSRMFEEELCLVNTLASCHVLRGSFQAFLLFSLLQQMFMVYLHFLLITHP